MLNSYCKYTIKERRSLKKTIKLTSIFLSVVLTVLSAAASSVMVGAETGKTISYSFANNRAGYAEGNITFSTNSSGEYKLYWADDSAKLSGYYPIKTFSFSSSGSKTYSFGDHIAIPYGATRVIAENSSGAVAAEYSIPAGKRLSSVSDSLRYKFNAYSDLHININGYFTKATERWEKGLQFGVDKGTDFIVITGDTVTNGGDPASEWKSYEKTLSSSAYVNPVWESDGNHDLKHDVSKGKKAYVRGSGTDNTAANYDANKPYYYITEKNSGDIFIFMALENDFSPANCDEFSTDQMNWVTNLIEQNYKRGVNIYICEHSPIKGFGAGDRMSNPYYKAHLSESYSSTRQFKALLKKYPRLIFMSGHTHEDFALNYNYSDENGAACSMIHIPALAGSTMPNDSDSALNYNNGKGFTSQGYLVEAYDNEIIYYGANIPEEMIYPEYTYIMEGYSSGVEPQVTPTNPSVPETEPATEPENTTPQGTQTKRIYFADSLRWLNVNCHSWQSGSSIKCVWPGYRAVYCGTIENELDLYYVDIPAEHMGIVWNNSGDGEQTVDITLDGVNNFFIPKEGQSGKKIKVDSYVWTYDYLLEPATEPETEPETEPGPVFEKGDVDTNGYITITDVTMIQKYLTNMITLREIEQELADVDESGDISIRDCTQIQKFLAQIITEFTPAVNPNKNDSDSVGSVNYKQNLDDFYTFSSYDQYQALKKLYKNGGTEEELSAANARLISITDHINGTNSSNYRDTYYFENTKGWSKVYAYAWKGSSKNASWPGVKLSKVGTNSGHDVYKVKFDSAGQYTSLIFDAGSGSSQTVNIDLSKYSKNAFYISGKDSDGKYTVGNFKYTE